MYVDRRFGDSERLSIGQPKDWVMRIPDDFFQTVCFLGVRYPDGRSHWGGTAFFVGIPWDGMPDWLSIYIVTARHNVIRARELAEAGNGIVCLRVNSRTKGDTTIVDLTPAKWIEPENPGTDVAILRWDPPDWLDYRTLPGSMLATEAVIKREGIGLGDELVMVGLFARRSGDESNLPVVRSGILSAEPSEPLINGLNGEPMHGCYLAELRSIAGLSGSPVFVFLPYGRTLWGQSASIRHSSGFYLLGLVHGHWPLDKAKYIDTDFGDGEEPLNTGIAVIVPITDALALIDSPAEIATRQSFVERERQANAPVPD